MIQYFGRNMYNGIKKLEELARRENVSPDFYDHLEEIKEEIKELYRLKKQEVSKNDIK